MSTSLKHLRHQGPVLRALGRTAVEVARQRLGHPSPATPIPGPRLSAIVPARDPDLVRAYVLAMGGDPAAYAGVVPPLLFPHWTFPLLGETLIGLRYPLARALNAGCRLAIRAPLPLDAPLHVEARLVGVSDDGQRALLHQTVLTGPADRPDALRIDFHPLIPLSRGPRPERAAASGEAPKDTKARVPEGTRELARWDLRPRDAFDFAVLTGDFNPIHWIRPIARAAGFANTILHGFATLGRAVEALNRELWGGDPTRLAAIDVRFTRPLVLPARVGLYFDEEAQSIYVGDAPGGPAYLTGRVRTAAPENCDSQQG